MRDFRHGPTRLPGSNMRQVYLNQRHSAGQRPDGAPRETHDAALYTSRRRGRRSGRSGMRVSFRLPAEQPRDGLLVLLSLESVGHQPRGALRASQRWHVPPRWSAVVRHDIRGPSRRPVKPGGSSAHHTSRSQPPVSDANGAAPSSHAPAAARALRTSGVRRHVAKHLRLIAQPSRAVERHRLDECH